MEKKRIHEDAVKGKILKHCLPAYTLNSLSTISLMNLSSDTG
jgi:hypothetical protein